MNKASQITSPGSGLLWIPKTTTVVNQWDSTNWKAVYKRINKIQTRITKATQRGNRNLAKKPSPLLVCSGFGSVHPVPRLYLLALPVIFPLVY